MRSPSAYVAATAQASIRQVHPNPESDAGLSLANSAYNSPPMPMPASATASTSPKVKTDPPSSGASSRYQTSSIRKNAKPTVRGGDEQEPDGRWRGEGREQAGWVQDGAGSRVAAAGWVSGAMIGGGRRRLSACRPAGAASDSAGPASSRPALPASPAAPARLRRPRPERLRRSADDHATRRSPTLTAAASQIVLCVPKISSSQNVATMQPTTAPRVLSA